MTWLVRPCDKWGEVTVGTHSYGAGPELAGADVAVGLGAHEVTIVSQGTGELVARYRRRFGGGVTVDVDPVAELRLLGVFSQAWLSVLSSFFFRVPARNFFGFRHGRAAVSTFPTFPA